MKRRNSVAWLRVLVGGAVGAMIASSPGGIGAEAQQVPGATASATIGPSSAETRQTATPIKHLVVIYDENISFDHYFATYPDATNPPGEPAFRPRPIRHG